MCFTLTSPSSTHGVPPMRSSVENMMPWSLSSMRAVVQRTQSSFAFESRPMSMPPGEPAPMSAMSDSSLSVSAVQSFVSTWIDMGSMGPRGLGGGGALPLSSVAPA